MVQDVKVFAQFFQAVISAATAALDAVAGKFVDVRVVAKRAFSAQFIAGKSVRHIYRTNLRLKML